MRVLRNATDHKLELLGLEEARQMATINASTPAVRTRIINRIETTHEILSALPTLDDLAFHYSGLCQTFLPHSRPENNRDIWKRQSGRFILMVSPGVLASGGSGRGSEFTDADYVGVPYGTKARLILFHLQTEGMKSRTVSLGRSLNAFLRSLGLPSSGGPRGSIAQVREQCMRIARCTFTLQFSEIDNGEQKTKITDTKIIDGMELWNASSDDWSGTVELSEKFHSTLIEHAVPLDKRSIALLAGNSFALDLYVLFAYRLRKLSRPLHLSWGDLQHQIGCEYSENKQVARRVRDVMPEVMRAYPHANVEIGRWGITMKPSKSSVPETMVNGFSLIKP